MYRILTLKDEAEWNNYLGKLPAEKRDIYFTPEYYRLYENLGDGEAHCFVFDDGNDVALYPFLKNEINKLGYDLNDKYYDIQGAYGYNGITSGNTDQSYKHAFFEALNEYCRANKIVAEFTRFHPLMGNQEFNDNYFTVVYDRQSVCFDLSQDPVHMFESFQHSTKRQINRATKRFCIEAVFSEDGEMFFDDVFGVYKGTMDRVGAVQELYFNPSFFREMLSVPGTVLFRALLDGKLIAFIIGFSGDKYFHGHLSGSLREYIHMSPNSLLYWVLINYARDHGFKYLHIGGGDTPDPENSLLKFKMNFSKDTRPFFIGKKIHFPDIYEEVVKQWCNSEGKDFVASQERLLLKYRNKRRE
jgi:hypothetical protein